MFEKYGSYIEKLKNIQRIPLNWFKKLLMIQILYEVGPYFTNNA